MKKSQSTIFIILGLVVLILVTFFIVTISNNREVTLSQDDNRVFSEARNREDVNNYIYTCVDDAVEEHIADTGIREETKTQYENLVSTGIKECVNPYFEYLEGQGYLIDEGDLNVRVTLNHDTIVVIINYPLSIERETQRFEFKEFEYTFDRATTIRIPGGETDDEVRLISPDGRAEIVIPRGVEIRDSEGNPVENIGLRVEDVHFDELENRYVVGELVYETLPDGVVFSEPVDIKIDYRDEDIMEGYTKENIKIGYWNEELGIWLATNTSVNNKYASAKISHFSSWTNLIGRPQGVVTTVFKKRFEPAIVSPRPHEGVWLVSGVEGSDSGTVSLQPDYNNDIKEVMVDQGDDFVDFRKERQENKEDYISQPVLQYGYFVDKGTEDEKFIDCESEQGMENPYGVKYETIDGYPYFRVCDYGCKNEVYCDCSSEQGGCASACLGVEHCNLVGGNNICVPSGIGNSSHCKIISPDDECTSYSEPIFGWHNYQCAGGRVRPAENEQAADFIVFEKNGNALIELANFAGVHFPRTVVVPHPTERVPYYIYLKDFSEIAGRDFNFPFYCEIVPFENGNLWQTIELSQSAKQKLGLNNEDSYFSFGVKGVNVIKKTDHWMAKKEINAQCELYYYFWGNGFIDANNPHRNVDSIKDIVSILDYLDIKLQDFQDWLDKVPAWVINRFS